MFDHINILEAQGNTLFKGDVSRNKSLAYSSWSLQYFQTQQSTELAYQKWKSFIPLFVFHFILYQSQLVMC